jgi:antitoxin component YwqK of YwqJK toxin-antitoxin module/uncharacterized lipoprotein YehR (DUF1307 family)
MNKSLACTIALIVVLAISACGDTAAPYTPEIAENRRFSLNLSPAVEVMREESWVFDRGQDGSQDTIETKVLEFKFDRNGQVLHEEMWRDGKFGFLTITTYDTARRVLEKQEYGAEGELNRSWTCLYGPNGRLAEKQGFTGDGKLFEKEVHRFDSENRRVWVATDFYDRTPSGKRKVSHYRTEYKYEGDSETRIHTQKGELEKVQQFRNNRIVKSERYSVIDGKLRETIEYQDSAGILIWTFRNGDGSLKQIEKRVNGPHGLVSDSKYGPDAELYAMEVRHYDEMGRTINEQYFSTATDKNGTPLDTALVKPAVTTYFYDPSHGQYWTECQIRLENRDLHKSIRRQVILFEDE